MKLSTKNRYGVRLMFDLALYSRKKPVLLKDAAKRQEISEKYLSQIIIPLTSDGIITSARGNPRGYTLSKKPEDITILDIIEILDGRICLVDCLRKPKECNRTEACVTRKVWKRLEDTIRKLLQSVSLQDLLDDYEKGGDKNSMYYI